MLWSAKLAVLRQFHKISNQCTVRAPYRMTAQSFTEQELRDLRLVFDLFSSDKKLITDKEVCEALRLLGFKTAMEDILALLQKVNTSGRRDVQFDTFTNLVSILQGSDFDAHEEIIQCFRIMDKDGDGYLSVEDLSMSSKEAKLKLKRRELQNIISEADKNGDGMVSEQEFVEVMLKTGIFNYV